MSSMNARFKSLGFGSKRKSSANNISTIPQNPTSSSPQLSQLAGQPSPPTQTASSSTASLPMNHPGGAGVRPPSYSNQYTPRTTSPMAQGTPRTPPTQMMGGPPPINTAATGGYPPTHPHQGGMGGPPPPAGPPQYLPPQYGAGGAPMQGPPGAQYGNRHNAVEVEGAGKSKAQLIVGIDFVSA
jgi:hypothetical protein